ncbi:Fungal specific transcription factor domain-containing protein isoform 2 [Cladophialophora immunda]|nr:Fungal specific transcription factor domain-containing protein isoform 2 [Cladophialophora immunda]
MASSQRNSNRIVSVCFTCNLFILIEERLHLFFDNVQVWLPIFHRPSFWKQYVPFENTIVSTAGLGADEIFMINAIFALTARFSTAANFDHVPILDRGDVFVDRAVTIKDEIMKTLEETSTEFLKACVLLASYYCTSGQLGQGSLLTSMCVRLAHDLALNRVDEDPSELPDPFSDVDAWVRKEDLRRLWWAIFDLDTFVSTVVRQPYVIERREMQVHLPVADHQWFSGIPLISAVLDHQPAMVWKSLQGCPNQAPRAWYLVCNYLMSCIAVAARQTSQAPANTALELDSALCCLRLALPAEYQLQSLCIDKETYREHNWILCCHFMILSCDSILENIRYLQYDVGCANERLSLYGKRIVTQMIDIARQCKPEYIPMNHPFMGCCIVVPGCLDARGLGLSLRNEDVSSLLLSHIGRYWKLGLVMQKLITAVRQGLDLKQRQSTGMTEQKLRRFSIFLPENRVGVGPQQPTPSPNAFTEAPFYHAATSPGMPDVAGVGPSKTINSCDLFYANPFDFWYGINNV